jgi:hypothetical protein
MTGSPHDNHTITDDAAVGSAGITRSLRLALVVVGVYVVVMPTLLSRLSLWLDEIIQLVGTRDLPLPNLMNYVASNSGGVPLGYILQSLLIHQAGYSPFIARFPSYLFAVLSCIGLIVVDRLAGVGRPALSVLLFATLPLHVRYALEARPYEQALCVTVWMTAVFLALVKKPSPPRATAYSALVLTGLYTHPFSAFVAVSHLFWVLLVPGRSERRRVAVTAGVALFIAFVGFLPWLLYAHSGWVSALPPVQVGSGLSARTPLMIVRELTGAGYAGSLLFIGVAAAAIRNKRLPPSTRLFLFFITIGPILLACIADATAGYFFAIRQIIFALPGLILLSALGIDALLQESRSRAACILVGSMMLANSAGIIGWFTRPRENWSQVANILVQHDTNEACSVFLPAEAGTYLAFFQPRVLSRVCAPDLPEGITQVIVVVIGSAQADVGRVHTRLRASGLQNVTVLQDGPPFVECISSGAACAWASEMGLRGAHAGNR